MIMMMTTIVVVIIVMMIIVLMVVILMILLLLKIIIYLFGQVENSANDRMLSILAWKCKHHYHMSSVRKSQSNR